MKAAIAPAKRAIQRARIPYPEKGWVFVSLIMVFDIKLISQRYQIKNRKNKKNRKNRISGSFFGGMDRVYNLPRLFCVF